MDRVIDKLYLVDDKDDNKIHLAELINNWPHRRETYLKEVDPTDLSVNESRLLSELSNLPALVAPDIKGKFEELGPNSDSAVLFLDFDLWEGDEAKNIESCNAILAAFAPSPHRIVVTSSQAGAGYDEPYKWMAKRNYLPFLVRGFSVARRPNSARTLCRGIGKWLELNSNPIDSALQLYDSAVGQNWDKQASAAAPHGFFTHDWFDAEELDHASKAVEWLALPTGLAFHDKSVKGLFMVIRDEDGSVHRKNSSEVNDPYAISAAYLKAALDRLEIDAVLQKGVASWNLPTIPGLPFLLAVKEFLRSLVRDDGDETKSPPPVSVGFYKWESPELDSKAYALEIQLDPAANASRRGLMERYEGSSVEFLRGSCLALRMLCDGRIVKSPGEILWSQLFTSPLKVPVAGIQFIADGVRVTWCRRGKRESGV